MADESNNALNKLLKARRRLKWIRRIFSLSGLAVFGVAIGLFVGGIAIIGSFGGSSPTSDSSSEGSGDLTGTNINAEMFHAAWQQYYIAGVMADKEKVVIEMAKKYGVSPALMAAIIGAESGWGTSAAIRNKNNPSGQMVGSEILYFPSLDAGIEATGKTLFALVVQQGLNTVETLGSHYAPVGAANDPNNMNVNWVPTVKQLMKEFGWSEDTSKDLAGGSGAKPNSKGWVIPVQPYQVTSPFMMGRINPVSGLVENHYGTDLVGSLRVNAAKTGTVMYSGMRGAYGIIVVLKHSDGWYSSYQHLASSKVKVGQKLNAGQQVGVMGMTGESTGIHLHFMIMKNYLFGGGNPGYIDPASVLAIR
jgi:murein DD-endopeptidase MepM/ murein hydrolase activator NlpD